MDQIKASLENLDEAISLLEDKIGLSLESRSNSQKKLADIIKQARAREANALAVAQKIALRLDQTIEHVENILKQ